MGNFGSFLKLYFLLTLLCSLGLIIVGFSFKLGAAVVSLLLCTFLLSIANILYIRHHKLKHRRAIEETQLYEQLQQKTNSIMPTQKLDQLSKQIVTCTAQLISSTKVSFLRKTKEEFEPVYSYGEFDPLTLQHIQQTLLSSTEHTSTEKKKVQFTTIQTEPFMIIPLTKENELLGVLIALSKNKSAYTNIQQKFIQKFANIAATAVANALHFEQINNLAMTDGLTGLYNRRHFYERATIEIQRAIRYVHPLSMILVDIDHFKDVNDTYGHTTGDEVLAMVAQRLTENLRKTDIVGRYGGEEFVILLPETSIHDAVTVAEHLREKIKSSPFVTTKTTGIPITISAGVTSLNKEKTKIDRFIDAADEALYKAKESGRDKVVAHHNHSQRSI